MVVVPVDSGCKRGGGERGNDQWEEEVSNVEWSMVGRKKNKKGKFKNRKKEGEMADLVHPKPSKRGPKPKGDKIFSEDKPFSISRKHGDVGSSLSPVGRPSNQQRRIAETIRSIADGSQRTILETKKFHKS